MYGNAFQVIISMFVHPVQSSCLSNEPCRCSYCPFLYFKKKKKNNHQVYVNLISCLCNFIFSLFASLYALFFSSSFLCFISIRLVWWLIEWGLPMFLLSALLRICCCLYFKFCFCFCLVYVTVVLTQRSSKLCVSIKVKRWCEMMLSYAKRKKGRMINAQPFLKVGVSEYFLLTKPPFFPIHLFYFIFPPSVSTV